MLQKTPSQSWTISERRGVGPLDVGWLEDLVAIADHRNFTKAAEARNFTQPALSRRIQSLEKWAGVPLIDRSQAPLVLTEAGKQLLRTGIDILDRLKDTRKTFRAEEVQTRAAVRLAATPVLSTSFLPRWIPEIQTQFDGTRISVSTKSLVRCFEALENGSADFVVGLLHPETQFRSAEFAMFFDLCSSITLGGDRLIPISAPDAQGHPIHSLQGNCGTPTAYLSYARSCPLGWAVEKVISQNRDLPKLDGRYDTAVSDGLRRMALSGLGAAWLPLTMASSDIERRGLVRAGDEHLDIDMSIKIFRAPRHLSDAAESFWDWLKAVAPPWQNVLPIPVGNQLGERQRRRPL